MESPIVLIQSKLAAAYTAFVLQLPNLIAALVLIVVAWFATRAMASLIARACTARGRPDLGALLGSLARGTVLIMVVLFAAAIVFPSVNPGDIFATLGIGSVAIGFAFKDILQNLLAGLLLVIQRPYKRGDQIAVKGFEGTVEQIETRATLLKTYDGRRVVIPNSDIYTSPVVVNTAFEQRRDELMVGIGYGDNPPAAVEFFRAAVAGVEGVSGSPAPEVLPWGLNDSTVDLKVRWWSGSARSDQVHIKARVIVAVAQAAKDHGVDLPFPTSVVLYHDQTEESDGDRTRQREGWPAGENPPRSRSAAQEVSRPSSASPADPDGQ